MVEKKTRNVTADVIRGFAIITVIIGHCIQQGNGLEYYTNSMFWSNKVYQFIYSFHMPLFMLLAGWFAYYSLKKLENNRKEQFIFLFKKMGMYIFPIFFWTLFEFVRGYILNKRLGNETTGFPEIIPVFISYFVTNLWFLWAILVCLIIVFVMHFWLKDNIILYALGFLALFFLPDGMNLGVYKFLMPYYIGAFYANMYKEKVFNSALGIKFRDRYSNQKFIFLIGFGIIFGILFALYNERAFIYLSGYKITNGVWFKQIALDMYRMIIGFVGSGFFIILIDMLVSKTSNYKWPVLTLFGKNSLGVYILQGYYILMVMVVYTNDLPPVWWRIIIETVVISVISLVSAVILGNIPIVSYIVGKSYKRKK